MAFGDFLAHSDSEGGRRDYVKDHLRDVGNRAAEFAGAFGAEEEARAAGILHDLGKYGELFQKRLEGKEERKEERVDHWSAGARVALEKLTKQSVAVAWVVRGHHAGLSSLGDLQDFLRAQSLSQFVQTREDRRLSQDDLCVLVNRLEADRLEVPAVETSVLQSTKTDCAAGMLDVRMLLSCVVDADYLETEAHYAGDPSGKRPRAPGPTLDAKRDLSAVLEHISQLERTSQADGAVTKMRHDLLEACLAAAEWPPGLYTLAAPTGAGKTLAMLAFALKHAAVHGLRRIVCVIPYLTIIEQTVRVYREALSVACAERQVSPQAYVLEDHSLAGGRGSDGERRPGGQEEDDIARLLAENWDAPVVVTTSVQFLESLFANRPRTCRKLHRLARSVILFDEVQTLPTRLIEPTLAALSRLSQRYGCTVVFSTATQPAFGHLHEGVRRYFSGGWQACEIVPACLRLFERARRVQVRWLGEGLDGISWEELARRLIECHQALCVVNLKRHAMALFDAVVAAEGEDGIYHLSTNMCPAHRACVLAEVRQRLRDGKRCLLVSTQCVEAGVDVDFPVVFRAWGPLEAVAQAAGRCNREGRLQSGTVYVFRPAPDCGPAYPDGAYEQAAAVAEALLAEMGGELDIYAPEVFERYYGKLYEIKGELTGRELDEAIMRLDFPAVAQLYRVIPEHTLSVLVPYCREEFDRLAAWVRQKGMSREWLLQARPHAVSIFRPRPPTSIRNFLEPVPVRPGMENSDEWFIYGGDAADYDKHKGLMLKDLSLLIA